MSRRVLQALTGDRTPGTATAVHELALGPEPMLADADAQLALWTLYELHYRGFDGVQDDLEWDPTVLRLRRTLERRFERELRAVASARLTGPGTESWSEAGTDVGTQLLALSQTGRGPSPAAHLHRHAGREDVVDFLRERSVQQLKESDPQSFVLPRLHGPAKVALAELLYDEFGGGRPERLHQRLYAEAMAGVGLDPTYGAYVDQVSATSLAMANAVSFFGLHRRLAGAAMGHLAVFEATSSVPSRKVAAGMERLGLPDAVAAYFHEHVEADAVHEHLAAHDICGAMVAEDPDQRASVLLGAAVCLHLDEVSAAELMSRWTPTEVAS
ncbi:iron-containing redox enzyme family protein [Nocardioides scoriae]|uniref:iron-containing redox enzyme family protein n=1 Tax=Nocardioides scoriae TaxID=642780 RepID=UPI001E3C2023|nr:iron-containing redox enzyme family protein [Nocardioides scoriae]